MQKRMAAAVMTGLHEIEVREAAVSRPKASEVLVRIRACGVCGSDVHYFNEGCIGDQIITGPQVLGHEPAGDVAAVGKNVTRVKEGDRVAVDPAFNCRRCRYCRSGQENLCEDLIFLGMPGLPGAFQQFLPVPDHCVEKIHAKMSYAEAVLMEPMSIAVHTADLAKRYGALKGRTVGIYGSGPVGLLVQATLKAAGARVLLASEPIDARRRMAVKLGAKAGLDPDRDDIAGEAMKRTRGLGLDLTFEAAGTPEALRDAIASTRKGGVVVVVGIPDTDGTPINLHVARRRELIFQNVRRSNRDLIRAIRLSASKVKVAPLHTHDFPLAKTAEALELVLHKRDGVIKAMVCP